MRKTVPAAVFVLCLAFAFPSLASTPDLINYQGTVTDAHGQPLVTGDYEVSFSIFDAPVSGAPVWGPQVFDGGVDPGHGALVHVVSGYFNVILGPLDTGSRSLVDAFAGSERYLEITVGSGDPISPRQRILSAPFALNATHATNADSLGGVDSTTYVRSDGDVYLSGRIFPGNQGSRYIDHDGSFVINDDVYFPQGTELTSASRLELLSQARSMLFSIDSDNNEGFGTSHSFIWARDTADFNASSKRMMQLGSFQEGGDNDGLLRIDGALAQHYSFDLAEAFWASEPVEPGDLIRVDPNQSNAVLLTSGADDTSVLGIVSTRPAIILGGGAFSAEDLRDEWGDDIADRFETRRSALRTELLDRSTGLETRLENLKSAADPTEAAPAELDRLQQEIEEIETDLDVETLALFFETHFAEVALAGRVPVKVDAQYGAIEPGDLLAPSPTPGVAMKANAPGPIVGTALEGLSEGSGKVLALVHRGHYAPARLTEPTQAVGSRPDSATGTRSVDGDLQAGSLHVSGTVRAASPGVAEYHPFSEAIEIGDVVVWERQPAGTTGPTGTIRRGAIAADPTVIGIVSSEPGIVLGEDTASVVAANPKLAQRLEQARSEGDREAQARIEAELESRFRRLYAPVALSGSVLCKVDAAYGSIRPGDLLTTSPTAGHAMRADDPSPGTVVGKALEPLKQGTGLITVMVMLR